MQWIDHWLSDFDVSLILQKVIITLEKILIAVFVFFMSFMAVNLLFLTEKYGDDARCFSASCAQGDVNGK